MVRIKKFIQRKTLFYKTKVEYGDYTINYILGCAHGCKYPCYAFMLKKRFGSVKSYEDWCQPALVENVFELLDKEIPYYKDKIKMLHLCFSTDPFMYDYNDVSNVSLKVIQKCNASMIPCSILTKGILPIELAQCFYKNEYGITLVSLSENFRKQMEPNSAPYTMRIQALLDLHNQGCKTWVSIEPYPTPNIIMQDLNEILESVSFVDKIIFGRMNYNSQVTNYKESKAFYNEKANYVIKWCKKYHKGYHIKTGTMLK